MKNVIYTPKLKEQLAFISKTVHELIKEDQNKSIEQFLAEIEFVEDQLKEVKSMIFYTGNQF